MKKRIALLGAAAAIVVVVIAGVVWFTWMQPMMDRPIHDTTMIAITRYYDSLPPQHQKPPVTVKVTDCDQIQAFLALYDSEVSSISEPSTNIFGIVGQSPGSVPEVEFHYGRSTIQTWRILNDDHFQVISTKGFQLMRFKSRKVLHTVNEFLDRAPR